MQGDGALEQGYGIGVCQNFGGLGISGDWNQRCRHHQIIPLSHM